MKLVVFDVETKKAFDEVGGYHPEKLGVSVSGVWVGDEHGVGTLRGFREEEFSEMFKIFETADRIVGFNSIDFDMAALQPYYIGDLLKLPNFDLLQVVEKKVGYRVKLDALAKETLGIQKGGNGLDAITHYHEGNWEKLIKYCLEDVVITKDLYLYGLKHGELKFKNKWNELVTVMVDFSYTDKKEASVQVTLF
ncbi:ribonuclease H-like domain-containing protein [Candidatus Woesebacteria bacterium]|nr:ribonuclease H-like domain-containing protein [Candidatus Woesebacteria bacterium]